MLQVSLLAFMASGAFLPMPYFDLAFQLMALSAVLAGCVLRGVIVQSPADPAVRNQARFRSPGMRGGGKRERTYG
jgi:hypothetical protein